ncbi:PIN domain-containing protein [Luteolibacter yonseiensis]|uniref:PIN domain-containing protein n=1 Tax=Luteolibacter yonseiensis TaxID=1144680 RepID=A0A934V812_9BACT|nr:PIN domain-containing protein [Luteolibacter yonseiensis]MBK1816757.1 PIN domain-containing protein [Luteolibacter yonseiensis]
MNVYPDTSFVCSLYRLQHTSQRAIELRADLVVPLPVSSLLLLEFRQSIRFQMRLFSKDRSKGFSKNEGSAMLRDLQSDLAHGVLEMISPDWADVHRIAEELSGRHTEAHGHRFADILHVATALHFGVATFFTFDANQKRLAEAEGMLVPV